MMKALMADVQVSEHPATSQQFLVGVFPADADMATKVEEAREFVRFRMNRTAFYWLWIDDAGRAEAAQEWRDRKRIPPQ